MTTNFLVVGGTGKTGRRVADRLRERDLPVRIASRRGAPPFDWADRATWAPVLEGIDAVYLTYYPDLVVPGAADDIRAFTELAIAEGVRHLVLLSGRGEEEAEACERIVAAADIGWTILRCSWFAQNFSEHFLLDAVRGGEIALPAGMVVEPFLDVRDIADVAVKALTEPGHTKPALRADRAAAADLRRRRRGHCGRVGAGCPLCSGFRRGLRRRGRRLRRAGWRKPRR